MGGAVFGPKNMAKTAKFLELLEKIWAEVERVAGVDLSPTVMEARGYRALPVFVPKLLHAAKRAGLSQPSVFPEGLRGPRKLLAIPPGSFAPCPLGSSFCEKRVSLALNKQAWCGRREGR
jgi:hypothetical protein